MIDLIKFINQIIIFYKYEFCIFEFINQIIMFYKYEFFIFLYRLKQLLKS